ncbi:predicted signal transduction protein containing a membrane domain, an EAL and a GGDEF domain [Solibacillus silvestris StLB046]|uniref:Predicted signal transduction protein containing a membrane domain, an EAL and a GGDEF domain n=1 Tax=Solibacillus silvestris (strain StLB046) TaxID=1002809 RepID=F2F0U2_SOLSS|nr:GGDEF and EAL domain-containing protein [Solibacillus silvestris]BAK16336.1 predicted signal transduction protein containing a membrane domain, an EAL and a GGDEF domain [Solibacillus silvestris StLB046]
MKYTWRLALTAILIISNFFIFSNLELSQNITLSIIVFGANVIGWMLGNHLDKYVSSKKELGTTLVDYTFALDFVTLGIGITNEKGEFEFVNKAHQDLYGYNLKEFLTKSWKDCYSPEMAEHLNNQAITQLRIYGKWKGKAKGIRKDGSIFPQELLISNIEGSKKMICVVRDITEQQQYLNYIEHIAEHNDLTKLPNRRKLLSDFDKTKKESVDTSILFIDLDRFKIVNDTLGHNYGDKLLISVAERLISIQNEYIKIYHLGGDEFIVIVQNVEYDYTEFIAIEIINILKKPYLIFEKEVSITCSIGICSKSEHGYNYEKLIELADIAMYHAKMEGKNTYKFFNEDIRKQLERNLLIENELRRAISNGEFFINYQPKCNLADSSLIGLEALVRWNNPLLGIVSPAEFIPIAEETGLINDIGNWVINAVLYQLHQWQSSGYPLAKISVNVSQRQFKENELVDYIEKCLTTYNIEPQYFEIEITESLIADFDLIIPQLTSLKNMGVGISIDDFGTGYSSLNFINLLPVDTLKIDQSFIRGLLSNRKNNLLVKTIIDIGNNLQLKVVAEGIETEEQLKELINLNCHFGQGYLFSKPLAADKIESILFKKLML